MKINEVLLNFHLEESEWKTKHKIKFFNGKISILRIAIEYYLNDLYDHIEMGSILWTYTPNSNDPERFKYFLSHIIDI